MLNLTGLTGDGDKLTVLSLDLTCNLIIGVDGLLTMYKKLNLLLIITKMLLKLLKPHGLILMMDKLLITLMMNKLLKLLNLHGLIPMMDKLLITLMMIWLLKFNMNIMVMLNGITMNSLV